MNSKNAESVRILLLALAAFFVVSGSARAQSIVVPADDEEALLRVRHFEEAFAAASRSAMGDVRSAINATRELWDEALDLHPGAQILVADRLARLHESAGNTDVAIEWAQRAVDLRLNDPDQRGGSGMSGRSLAHLLMQAGRHAEAAEAIASVDHAEMSDHQRASLLREVAGYYDRAGDRDGQSRALQEALAAVEASQPGSRRHFQILTNLAAAKWLHKQDPEQLAADYGAIYLDPRFESMPDRLMVAGINAVFGPYLLGDHETVDRLAEQIYAEAAAWEEEIGYEAALKADIDEAYMHAALRHSSSLQQRHEYMRALEVLESAYVAYPDARLAGSVVSRIANLREGLGLDPQTLPEPRNVEALSPVVAVGDQGAAVKSDRSRASHNGAGTKSRGASGSSAFTTSRVAGIGVFVILAALVLWALLLRKAAGACGDIHNPDRSNPQSRSDSRRSSITFPCSRLRSPLGRLLLVAPSALVLAAFAAASTPGAGAQVIRIDADDEEGLELMQEFDAQTADAERLVQAGDIASAIDAYRSLYELGQEIHPGAAILVAQRLGDLYLQRGDQQASTEWYGRAVRTHEGDADQRRGTGMAGRKYAASLKREGRHLEAARAYEAAVSTREDVRTQQRTWTLAAMSYRDAGMLEKAREVYRMTEPLLDATDPSDIEYLSARTYPIFAFQPQYPEDPKAYLDLLLDVHNDPRLRDVPERLNSVGWLAVQYASTTGRLALAEEIARGLFEDAARFEAELDADRLADAGIDAAYVNAAIQLSSVLTAQQRIMEAIEVLESAYRTYPDSPRAADLVSRLHSQYAILGLDASNLPTLTREDAKVVMLLPDGTHFYPGADVRPAYFTNDEDEDQGNDTGDRIRVPVDDYTVTQSPVRPSTTPASGGGGGGGGGGVSPWIWPALLLPIAGAAYWRWRR